MSDYEDTKRPEEICYICRRPESKAGKMIHIPNNICICQDCMQKTFDTMNQGSFPYMDLTGGMPNMFSFMGAGPKEQPKKEKKAKKKIGFS